MGKGPRGVGNGPGGKAGLTGGGWAGLEPPGYPTLGGYGFGPGCPGGRSKEEIKIRITQSTKGLVYMHISLTNGHRQQEGEGMSGEDRE